MGMYYCQCCDSYRDSKDGSVICEKCNQDVCVDCVNLEIEDETGKEFCLNCKPETED